jgi:hypothetical protein
VRLRSNYRDTLCQKRINMTKGAFSRTSLSSVCSEPMLFEVRRPSTGLGSSAWARVWK